MKRSVTIAHRLALMTLAVAGVSSTLAHADPFVDTGFQNVPLNTVFGNASQTIDGNNWNFWIASAPGTINSISVVSANDAKGAATRVMQFSEPTPDTTNSQWWMPQTAVFFGSAGSPVNLSSLKVDFDLYYVGNVASSNATSFHVVLRDKANKAAASIYLWNNLSADTWYHVCLISNDNGTPGILTDDYYTYTVVNSATGTAAVTPTKVNFGSTATGGIQDTANMIFQLGENNGGIGSPNVYLDNVKVSPIPEPAAVSILGIGAYALIARTSSRR